MSTILMAHNSYRTPGGEDRVFAMEAALLESRGHSVIRYHETNGRIRSGLFTGISAVWNHSSYTRIRALAKARTPQVAHFHNTFPLISPAAYYAAKQAGVPVVQKLSNFRLLCPGGLFLRNGEPCEACLERRSFRPALADRCYRGSFAATAAVSAMLTAHRAAGTWRHAVDLYVALSQFARNKFAAGGLPADQIVVQSNFVAPDPGLGDGHAGYALFVGRLSEEKGIRTLLRAWRALPEIPLVVAGGGPLKLDWPPHVTCAGEQTSEQVFALMKAASVLIFPSICYENAPVTILEAFACGLPVIASNLGSIPEMVTDRRTGLLFRPGDAGDLAQQVRRLLDNPPELARMRELARREYLQKYTPEQYYRALLEIYGLAMERAARREIN